MSNVLPNERISNVASEITKAFRGVVAKDQDRRDARDQYQAASNDAGNARENFLVTLSEISDKQQWSQYEIEQGIDKALAQRNDTKDNTIKTFAAEIKRACHPNARKHVRALAELATSVWETEVAQDKKLPRPCRDAFARKYHMLQRMIGVAIDDHMLLQTPHDVVQFALGNDPRKNPERVFKKFKSLREQLRELADEFPLDELIDSCEQLREIVLADFKHPDQRPEKSTAKAADAHEPTSEGDDSGDDENAPVMGVSDLLDEALKDISA